MASHAGTKHDPIASRLPVLGFGAASLGYMYTPVSDEEAAAVIEAMWAAGIRLYDTAALYGGGLSEVRLGKGLARYSRSEYILCTKVGRSRPFGQRRLPDGSGDIYDFSYDFALRSVADSLKRLGTDRLDVVHIHDPDDHLDEAMQGTYRALERLRDEAGVESRGGLRPARRSNQGGRTPVPAGPSCRQHVAAGWPLGRASPGESAPIVAADSRGVVGRVEGEAAG